ncbi:MAG: hypothetical protein HC942_03800 [Microcoleus sp. SU_5_6]|nr:hypothetical protein [Microcoleus sp. SU_5_6]
MIVDRYLLPITNYQLPITNYQLPITNYRLLYRTVQIPDFFLLSPFFL